MWLTRSLFFTKTKSGNLYSCFDRTILNGYHGKGYVSKNLAIRCNNLLHSDSKGNGRIYYGSLTSRVKTVKAFTLTTSLTGFAAQPILIEQGTKLGGTSMAIFMCGFVGFFTFVTPFLLHFITKKYVTEIHYNPENEEYTAKTISIFLTPIETKFKISDVKVPEVPGMFTSFLVGKRSLFVEPTLFTDTNHYMKIMGYDKPIDFKLNLSENNKEK